MLTRRFIWGRDSSHHSPKLELHLVPAYNIDPNSSRRQHHSARVAKSFNSTFCSFANMSRKNFRRIGILQVSPAS